MTDDGQVGRRPTSGPRLRRLGRAVRVVHPVPSAVVAAAAVVLARDGGAPTTDLVGLAVAMLGFQFSIGAFNDLADVEADRRAAPGKPIPSGIVSARVATVVAWSGAAVGIALSALVGPLVALIGVAGWACGVAYDVWLRRRGLGWLAFALALPLLLAWTWAAAGSLPATWPLLLLAAALAGPMLHLANSLVDVEADRLTGQRTLATALGAHRARLVLGLLAAAILVLALLVIVAQGGPTDVQLAGFVLGAGLAAVGVLLGWAASTRLREAGWLLLAIGMIPLAAAWIAG